MEPRRGRHDALLRRPDDDPRVGLRLDVDNIALRSSSCVRFARLLARRLTLFRRPRGSLLATSFTVQRHRRRPATHAWASLQVRSCRRVASTLARRGQRIAAVPAHLYYTDLLFVHGVHVRPFQRQRLWERFKWELD